MQPEPKKHVSHAIAWSLVALFAGSLVFGIWMYSSQIDTIYSGSANLSVTHKKTTAKPTTATTGKTATSTTADWQTYTNSTYNFSFKYPKDWKVADDSKGDIALSDTKKSYTSEGSDMAPIIIQYIADTSGADINKYLSNAAMKAILKPETVKIGGQTAYVVQGSTPPTYHDTRIIFYNNNVISFSSNGTFLKDQDTTSSINTTFNKLLGTVKFTTVTK